MRIWIFCPQQRSINKTEVNKDIQEFDRKIKVKAHFARKEDNENFLDSQRKVMP